MIKHVVLCMSTHGQYQRAAIVFTMVSRSESCELLPLVGYKSAMWNTWFPAKNDAFIETKKKKRNMVYCAVCDNKIEYSRNATDL